MTFGAELRSWREQRGYSQLRLATDAEVSQRHISFLENDRARPSREMVVHLGRSLRVPIKDQNRLLAVAGFAPAYSESPLGDLAEVGAALQFMLAAHEPNMAIVIDRSWNVVFANTSAMQLLGALAPDPPLLDGQLNVIYGMFHPEGLGGHVLNRSEIEPVLLWRLKDDMNRWPNDPGLERLWSAVAEISERPAADMPAHGGLVSVVRLRLPKGDASFFSCIARVEGSADLTVESLRLETFFPADADSQAIWSSFADSKVPR